MFYKVEHCKLLSALSTDFYWFDLIYAVIKLTIAVVDF